MDKLVGRPRKYASNAERVRAYRERNKLRSFTVELDQDTYERFEQWLRFKDVSKSSIVERLIKTQLLRRR